MTVGLAETCNSSSSASACGSETGQFVTDKWKVCYLSVLPIICYFSGYSSSTEAGAADFSAPETVRVVDGSERCAQFRRSRRMSSGLDISRGRRPGVDNRGASSFPPWDWCGTGGRGECLTTSAAVASDR